MRQLVYTGLIVILSFHQAFSQDKDLFKKTFMEAEYFLMTEEYQEALHLYTELLKIDPDNSNLHFLVSACYLSLYGQKEKAIHHLEKALRDMSPSYREGSYKERSAPREAYFALATAYHIAEEFDKAIEQYENYRSVMIKKSFADVEYVNHQIKSCELAKSMIKRPVDVQYLRLPEDVNRFTNNYNPVVSWDDSTLIYMTDRPLYRAIMMVRRLPGGDWTEPRVINDEIGSEGNSYPTSISADGRELYLVTTDPYGSDIYISYLKNGRFTKMIPLNNQVNSGYSETHACISFNGKTLYFTSDRPGGQGALDIWISQTTEEGDWGEPRNLGPKINSHYSEETPFLADMGKRLYFSSQGHATMGGFDFFVAEKLPVISINSEGEPDKSRGSSGNYFDAGWSFPENLGYPISTADNDLFYYPRKSGQGAYISGIFRDIDQGRNIYSLRIKGEQPQIAAKRQGTGIETEPLALKTPKVTQQDTTSTEQGTTSKEQKAAGTGEGTAGGEAAGDALVSTGIDGAEGTPPAGDEYFVLNSILFEFDSDDLDEDGTAEAQRVLEVMGNNPGVNIRLTGHTDAVGTDDYNLKLSERRAQSVADYLISNGIDESRISVTAAGETRPIAINKYEDGTDSPDGRRLNRHVSIKLENLQSNNVRVENVFVPDELKPKFDRSYSVLLVNSEVFIDTIPDEVAGEETVLIITDSAFLYTAGNFRHKPDAMFYLNEVIDQGYPEAGMLEEDEFERLIASLSEQGISVSASFTIQIMALSKPVPPEKFTDLKDVVKYEGKDGLHRYVYGEFDSLGKAMDMLPRIKKMGYDDAFIMSVMRYERLAE